LSGVGTNLFGSDPNTTSNVLSNISYRDFGATQSLNYGNGRTLAMSYSEQRHQLTSMIVQKSDGSDRIVDKSYEYYDTNQANTGRLMKQTDHLDPAYSVTYAYDGVNQLSSAQAGSVDTVKGYDRTYSYDEWGNLRTVSGDSDGTAATQFSTSYNYAVNGTGAPATNRLTDVNGVPYSYDAAGNLTNDGTISYTYDAANRMKTSNGGQSLYYYDGDGHRVRRDFPGTSPLFYVWSSVLGQVAMEVRPQTVVRAYVYMGGSPVALQNWDGTFVWIHKDHLGSTSLLTKTDGSVACKTHFDPYGHQVMLWVNPVGGTSISQGFTGYEKDNPTGLYNAQARMYSYGQARFLQPDPLGVGAANPTKPQSFNRYSYVQNDPVNFKDPSGLFIEPIDPGLLELYCNSKIFDPLGIGPLICPNGGGNPDPRGPQDPRGGSSVKRTASFTFVYAKDVSQDNKEHRFRSILGKPVAEIDVDKAAFCSADAPNFTIRVRFTTTNIATVLWGEGELSFNLNSAFDLVSVSDLQSERPDTLPNGDVINGHEFTVTVKRLPNDYSEGTLTIKIVGIGTAETGSTLTYQNRVPRIAEVKLSCKER